MATPRSSTHAPRRTIPWHGRIGTIFTLLPVGLAAAPPVLAQAPPLIEVREDISYEIVLGDSVVVGDADGPGVVNGAGNSAEIGPDGRIYVMANMDPFIQVFSPGGRFLQIVGREGDGPGEYRTISGVHFVGDSVYVLDGRQSRLTVLDAQYEVVRTARLAVSPGTTSALWPKGSIAINAGVADPDLLGTPIHVVDATTGNRRFALDGGSVRYRGDRFLNYIRILEASSDGSLWSARLNVYQIDRFGPDGERRTRLTHSSDHFPGGPGGVTTPETGPVPYIADIEEADSGRLWVVQNVPDAEWQDGIVLGEGPHGSRIVDYHAYMDTVIDVIDVVSGKLVARTIFPFSAFKMPAPGKLLVADWQSPLYPVLKIYDVTLVPQTGGKRP